MIGELDDASVIQEFSMFDCLSFFDIFLTGNFAYLGSETGRVAKFNVQSGLQRGEIGNPAHKVLMFFSFSVKYILHYPLFNVLPLFSLLAL